MDTGNSPIEVETGSWRALRKQGVWCGELEHMALLDLDLATHVKQFELVADYAHEQSLSIAVTTSNFTCCETCLRCCSIPAFVKMRVSNKSNTTQAMNSWRR